MNAELEFPPSLVSPFMMSATPADGAVDDEDLDEDDFDFEDDEDENFDELDDDFEDFDEPEDEE